MRGLGIGQQLAWLSAQGQGAIGEGIDQQSAERDKSAMITFRFPYWRDGSSVYAELRAAPHAAAIISIEFNCPFANVSFGDIENEMAYLLSLPSSLERFLAKSAS
jgi:hypothetical protein